MSDDATIKDQVRERYSRIARQTLAGGDAGCCGAGACCGERPIALAPVHQLGYDEAQVAALPEGAVAASLGCGNPTALIDLHPGQTVLDLGSGGGIDVLLSARRVGPTGRAIGLDMTDEMLALARANAAAAGATNVEFLKGEMEAIPLPDASVDVVISNCVVNLSPDKDAVLREARRVLKPGGRFAISDIVVQGGAVPPDLQADMMSWTGCVAGALEEGEYRAKLHAAGFTDPEIVVTAEGSDLPGGGDTDARLRAAGVRVVSAFVRATKPTP